ncbi:LLM class flavin-dependent oxidoreductase [Paenibacillus spiritus]|uniref:LLM class flavin-dependent oxidoreductase n=1 Tax=Paenibacillus spiritus TaxID=2496557 RepID=A0A5J5FXG3_9BACL|nr:LLM class flavin-dependent oxidoreductase [Paenibacillus spiritus]KAA8998792.1 LLM class flavin-dependent oxidoreductase [Paenibacillus spiritus]
MNASPSASAEFEFGVYTLGDLVADPLTGQSVSAHRRLKEIVAAARLADEAGLDVFGVGEHHRLDFAVSSVPVVLSALSQVTERIRLASTTMVLSTIDPVRLFEDFATLDLLSDGRAEIMVGRGAFTESFPLFGYNLEDYQRLFAENIGLLRELGERESVTWEGEFRPSLHEAEIAPRPYQRRLPLWVGVGGTPASAERAGQLGAGMALAILGGSPERFAELAGVYRAAGAAAGHPAESLRVAITSHCFIGRTPEAALDSFYPYYLNYLNGFWAKDGRDYRFTREEFSAYTAADNALAVGSPEQIVEKILYQHELFGHTRFMAQMDVGGMPYAKVAESIELLATEVAPAVRREIARRSRRDK